MNDVRFSLKADLQLSYWIHFMPKMDIFVLNKKWHQILF